MLTIILVILLIGLILTVLELFFIPGTTIIGILGILFSIAGIVLSYRSFGTDVGHIVLIATSAAKVGVLYYSFQRRAWNKFSLQTTIDSRVNEGLFDGLSVGAEGHAVSTLRPYGKAAFGDRQFEVRTLGTYVDQGKAIRITEINSNQIIVEPTN